MNSSLRFPKGLYGITPEWSDFGRLLDAVQQACKAGLPVLQWRRKNTPFELACVQAAQVAQYCKEYGTLFVINDDWRLALEVQADAVHLGRDDGDIQSIKNTLAEKQHSLLIGMSCYNQLPLAKQAIALDIDYFAFGAVFPSSVKPDAVHAPLSLFSDAQTLFTQTPRQTMVAIGGITLDNAPAVIAAGADSIAVISGLFEQADVYNTCKAFNQLFKA